MLKEKVVNLIRDSIAFDNCISSYGEYDNYDVNAKIARHNYKMYQEDLKRRQQNLIEEWCKRIKEVSRNGAKYIETNRFIVDENKDKILYLIDDAGCCCDFTSNSSLQYFRQYFEDRGFDVMIIEYPHNICSLQISWLY